MNNKQYRGAIIGAGNMGRNQARAFGSLSTISATYDVNPAQAERLAGELGATAYIDCAELLKNVDFVVICTPPTHRVELFRQALEAKVAILLEKPLAGDYATAQEIAALAKGSNVPLAVGYCHRFVPAVQEVLRIKKSGAYGRLRYLSQSFVCGTGARALRQSWMSDAALSGGGVVMDTLCHSIDLTQFLGGTYVRESAMLQSDWPGRAETTASIQAMTEEGVLVEVRGSWDYPVPRFDLRATFESAEVTYIYGAPSYTLQKEGEAACEVPVKDFTERVATQARAFIDLLEGRSAAPLCTLEEALRVSRVTDACYRQNGVIS